MNMTLVRENFRTRLVSDPNKIRLRTVAHQLAAGAYGEKMEEEKKRMWVTEVLRCA